jgi:hypothetical protein
MASHNANQRAKNGLNNSWRHPIAKALLLLRTPPIIRY